MVPKSPLRDKRFLVAEDDQVILHLISKIIKEQKAEVVNTTEAKDIIHILKTNKVDAIVLDRYFGNFDALNVVKQIRADKTHQEIPIIMLTGQRIKEEVKKAVGLGVNGYIGKPFRTEDFIRQLTKILSD